MNITADTTDAEILAPLDRAKQNLLDETTKALEANLLVGERLVGLAQNVRSREAVANVQFMYLNACRNTEDQSARIQALFDILTRNMVGDTTSGRGNDSARSANDAIRAWVSSQMDYLRRG